VCRGLGSLSFGMEGENTVRKRARRIVDGLSSGEALFEDVESDAGLRDEHWHYIVIYAARAGSLSVLEKAIALNKAPLTVLDEDGNTVLHIAVLFDRPSIARWLLKMTSRVLLSMKNNAGYTPLEEAARRNSIPLVRVLFETDLTLLETWSEDPELRASYTSALALAGEDLVNELRLHIRTSQVASILGWATNLDEAKVQAATFDWWAVRESIEWSEPERITIYSKLQRAAISGEWSLVEWLIRDWGADLRRPHNYLDNGLSIADNAALGALGRVDSGGVAEALQHEDGNNLGLYKMIQR
jgi:hypothetical protein